MAAGSHPLRHALLDLDSLRLVTLQHLHAFLPQDRRKSIGPCIHAASHIDDVVRILGNRVEEYLVVIPCSGIEVIVKGLRPKKRNLALTQPYAAPPLEEWEELPHETIGVLEFPGFVNRLDIARFCDTQRIAESRIRHRSRFYCGIDESELTSGLSQQGFNSHTLLLSLS